MRTCGASVSQQRQRRESVPLPTVALVGYTNAGKSTLFNALTKAGVLESSKMFATLDPTVRAITLPSKRKVLLSDTVGFIRNLPTTLVTAFRATLEEVQRAVLLLHVADVTSHLAHDQQTQVESVLKELEVMDRPQIRVMNKIDLLPEAQRRELANNSTPFIFPRQENSGWTICSQPSTPAWRSTRSSGSHSRSPERRQTAGPD